MAVTKTSAATQALIDKAVQDAVTQAQQGMVAAVSKPQNITHLRDTWRKSAEHLAEQLKRFLRILAFSAVTPVCDLILKGAHFDKVTLLMLLVPLAETAFRQVFPALGAAGADSAPGVTIVPEQVAPSAPVDNTAPVVSPVVDPTVGTVPIIPTSGDAAP